jgi:hypothetical protein
MIALLRDILDLDPRIRMVVSTGGNKGHVVKVARDNLDSLEVDDEWSFLNIIATSMVTMFDKYQDRFGKLTMSGACMNNLNFFFFRRGTDIILVSYDPCPITEIYSKLKTIL